MAVFNREHSPGFEKLLQVLHIQATSGDEAVPLSIATRRSELRGWAAASVPTAGCSLSHTAHSHGIGDHS
jgi:hypothetical protein